MLLINMKSPIYFTSVPEGILSKAKLIYKESLDRNDADPSLKVFYWLCDVVGVEQGYAITIATSQKLKE